MIAFLNALAIHCVFSSSIISKPTKPPDFQSWYATIIGLIGLPVYGCLTKNDNLCPSPISTSPTSSFEMSLVIYGRTLS